MAISCYPVKYYVLYVSDILSSLLQYKVVSVKGLSFGMSLKREVIDEAEILLLENLSEFKEEVANCSKFAKLLSSGVDIFVNDSFSRSHKVLASTVGVARFCGACVAGFYFEECLSQLKNAIKANKKLFAAIVCTYLLSFFLNKVLGIFCLLVFVL